MHESISASVIKLHRRMSLDLYFSRYDSVLDNVLDTAIPNNVYLNSNWFPTRQKWSPLLDAFISDSFAAARQTINLSTTYYNNDAHVIRNTLLNLRRNTNIIIKPADKNLGLCVLNPNDYVNICMLHLNDATTYLLVPVLSYSSKRLFATLRMLLNSHNMLNMPNVLPNKLSKLATSLLQLENSDSLRIAPFYCTIKVHKKPPYPGRPIVSTPATVAYFSSVYLDKILQPLLHKIPSVCLSSSSVIRDNILHPHPLSDTTVLLTADVAALYPSIPIEAGIAATRRTCEEFNFMLPKLDFLMHLLSWVLNNNYCTFNNVIYKQIKGTAMGTPVAVCFANFYLYQIEKPIIYLCPYYRRYIDDIFAICNNPFDATLFIERFNSVCDTIVLDAVTIDNHGIFLDLEFTVHDKILCHKLYQKPSNKYSYIPVFSDHHPSIFRNFILQELKRYSISCTSYSDFSALILLFARRLRDRGYPYGIFALALANLPSRATLTLTLTLTATNSPNPNPKPVIVIAIPRLYPNPNWRTIFTVPEQLLSTLEYSFAYRDQPKHVIIGKKSGRNVSHLLMSSLFPQHDT